MKQLIKAIPRPDFSYMRTVVFRRKWPVKIQYMKGDAWYRNVIFIEHWWFGSYYLHMVSWEFI